MSDVLQLSDQFIEIPGSQLKVAFPDSTLQEKGHPASAKSTCGSPYAVVTLFRISRRVIYYGMMYHC